MREITEAECEEWAALAREHGFADEEGRFELGRFVTEVMGEGLLRLVFITPLAAGAEDENLKAKTPPVMFDRTQDGRIILPGRWWQHMLERLAESDNASDDFRRTAWIAAHNV